MNKLDNYYKLYFEKRIKCFIFDVRRMCFWGFGKVARSIRCVSMVTLSGSIPDHNNVNGCRKGGIRP